MGWTTKNPRTLSPFLDCKGLASLSQRHLVYNTLSRDQNSQIISTNTHLSRVGSDLEESPMKKAKGNGIELNARGIPARKRKKNSLIYGADDLVSVFINLSLICLL